MRGTFKRPSKCCHMALKTGESPLRKHRQSAEKETIHFLAVKATCVSLLHFDCFRSKGTNYFQTFSVMYFSLKSFLIMVLFNHGSSREKG